MTAEEIKEDIDIYDHNKMVLENYTKELQYFRTHADDITIDSVAYYVSDPCPRRTLAFYSYRTLGVQSIIDSLEQNIKDIKCEMADIREKYKGVIDFEG